jgi:hypothetical protein
MRDEIISTMVTILLLVLVLDNTGLKLRILFEFLNLSNDRVPPKMFFVLQYSRNRVVRISGVFFVFPLPLGNRIDCNFLVIFEIQSV